MKKPIELLKEIVSFANNLITLQKSVPPKDLCNHLSDKQFDKFLNEEYFSRNYRTFCWFIFAVITLLINLV